MRTKIAGAILGASLLLAPLGASAASLTEAQVTAVINLLQSFEVDSKTVATVKAVLTGSPMPKSEKPEKPEKPEIRGEMMGVVKGHMTEEQRAKMMCMKLVRNLSQGSRGEDVKKLQELLRAEGVLDVEATGNFGSLTKAAMIRYQMHLGLATSSASGHVGPATRALLERRCKELKERVSVSATTTASVQ